jgi:hypothetical protein
MARAVNRVAPASISNDNHWDDVAQALRSITVQVTGPAGNHGTGIVGSAMAWL